MYGHLRWLAVVVVMGVVLTVSSPEAVPVNINKATTFQTMEGMGAMNRIQPWKVRSGPFYVDAPLTGFYDSLVNVMGFTILRPAPELCAFSPSSGVYSVAALRDEYKYYLALKAVANASGEPFWAMPSVFSPPGYLKYSGVCPGGGESTYPGNTQNTLRSDAYTAYGQVIAAYLRLLRDSLGITAKALSLQNEPYFNEPYASCSYADGNHYAQMLKGAGPAVRQLGYGTLLYGVEHMAFAYPSWENAILGDAQAAPLLDRFAIHGYSDGVRVDTNSFDSLTATGGKPLWMTETGGTCETYADCMSIARQIMKAFASSSMSSWQFCGLISAPSSCGWLVDATTGAPGPAYWAHAHFARFARPGMKRVAATCTDAELLVAAFKDDTKSSMSVVLINTNTSAAKSVTLACTGGSLPTQFETRTTSAAAYFASGSVAGNATITVPANGMVSLGYNHRGAPVKVAQPGMAPGLKVPRAAVAARAFDLTGRSLGTTLTTGRAAVCRGVYVVAPAKAATRTVLSAR
jgi:O-glycosyl hydrolase